MPRSYIRDTPEAAIAAAAAAELLDDPEREAHYQKFGDIALNLSKVQLAVGRETYEQWEGGTEAQTEIEWRERALGRYEEQFANISPDSTKHLGKGHEGVAKLVEIGREKYTIHTMNEGAFAADERAALFHKVEGIPNTKQLVAYSLHRGEVVGTYLDGVSPYTMDYRDAKTSHFTSILETLKQLHSKGVSLDRDLIFHPKTGFGIPDFIESDRGLASHINSFVGAVAEGVLKNNSDAIPLDEQIIDMRVNENIRAGTAIEMFRRFSKALERHDLPSDTKAAVNDNLYGRVIPSIDQKIIELREHRDTTFFGSDDFSETDWSIEELQAL